MPLHCTSGVVATWLTARVDPVSGVSWPDLHRAADRSNLEGLKELGLVQGSIEAMMDVYLGALFMPHGTNPDQSFSPDTGTLCPSCPCLTLALMSKPAKHACLGGMGRNTFADSGVVSCRLGAYAGH